MVFLPEGADYLAENSECTVRIAEKMDGPIIQSYKELAANLGIWLSVVVHVKVSNKRKFSLEQKHDRFVQNEWQQFPM